MSERKNTSKKNVVKKNVLMVIAHADDEILWGWPVLQPNDKYQVTKILLCSTDMYNPQRQWCSNRVHVLVKLCQQNNIQLEYINFPSEFYASDARSGKLKNCVNEIVQNLKDCVENSTPKIDIVFTHNIMGEYGHCDHKLVWDIVLHHSTLPILYTDISLENGTWPLSTKNIPKNIYKTIYYNGLAYSTHGYECQCQCDKTFFNNWVQAYKDKNVFTWNNEIVDQCNLYQLK